jgi:hypothetical protein
MVIKSIDLKQIIRSNDIIILGGYMGEISDANDILWLSNEDSASVREQKETHRALVRKANMYGELWAFVTILAFLCFASCFPFVNCSLRLHITSGLVATLLIPVIVIFHRK